MAYRYLRASGNWNGPVWAATAGGAAGSAATPTADDEVNITANFTVTLTSDASIAGVFFSAGRINLSQYKLSCSSSGFKGSAGATLDLGSGELHLSRVQGSSAGRIELASGMSVIAGSSTIRLDVRGRDPGGEGIFATGNHTFNDVVINMGEGASWATDLYITGSPTFRSLIIQSKNSEAHTVNLSSHITVDKFIGIGASTSNRLTISGPEFTEIAPVNAETSTCYGQFLHMDDIFADGWLPEGRPYIGSNSTQSSGAGWLLQDPPKISTLVDPLTTAPGSNANWTATGTINTRADGLGGGGYSGTAGATLTSTGTYDLIGSKLVFERPVAMPSGDSHFGAGTAFTYSNRDIGLWSRNTDPGDPIEGSYANRYEIGPAFGAPMAYYPIDEPMFVRLEVTSNGYFTISHSEDGLTWAIANDGYLNEIEMLLLRSTRIKGAWSGTSHIGSINMLPAPPEQDNTGAFFQFFH